MGVSIGPRRDFLNCHWPRKGTTKTRGSCPQHIERSPTKTAQPLPGKQKKATQVSSTNKDGGRRGVETGRTGQKKERAPKKGRPGLTSEQTKNTGEEKKTTANGKPTAVSGRWIYSYQHSRKKRAFKGGSLGRKKKATTGQVALGTPFLRGVPELGGFGASGQALFWTNVQLHFTKVDIPRKSPPFLRRKVKRVTKQVFSLEPTLGKARQEKHHRRRARSGSTTVGWNKGSAVEKKTKEVDRPNLPTRSATKERREHEGSHHTRNTETTAEPVVTV